MPAPSDRNALIALAKEWTVERKRALDLRGQLSVWKGEEIYEEYWRDPDGQYQGDRPPDFVGTLEGVSGMLRELYEATDRVLEVLLMPFNDGVQCILDTVSSEERYFWAPWERWGDCVGDAWLSVKEAADGS